MFHFKSLRANGAKPIKTTTVTCDTCGSTLSGRGWSALWGKAAKRGWIKGKDAQKHYCCAKCMVAQYDYLIKDYSAKTTQ